MSNRLWPFALSLLLLGFHSADAYAYRCGQSRPCAGGFNPYNPDSYNNVYGNGHAYPGAGGGVATEVAKTVRSGENAVLRFYYAVNPDCSSRGPYSITLTHQPAYGRVSVRSAMDYPNFPQSNVRFTCNRQRVRGDQVLYQTSPGVRGSDGFDVQVVTPDHSARSVHYTVTVE